MHVEDFRNYCMAKAGVTETFPFDESTLVFKVGGKMFALTGLDRPQFSINLKCDPDRAVELRENYDCVLPGYHMSKKHWNTVEIWGDQPDAFYLELIDHSYDLVYQSLPKKIKVEIEAGLW